MITASRCPLCGGELTIEATPPACVTRPVNVSVNVWCSNPDCFHHITYCIRDPYKKTSECLRDSAYYENEVLRRLTTRPVEEQKIEELEAEVDRLQQALEKYGFHLTGCKNIRFENCRPVTCECGLADELARVNKRNMRNYKKT
jgi:hypothetical protein